MKKLLALSLCALTLQPTTLFADSVRSNFDAASNTLELTDLQVGGQRYYVRLILTDINTLTFQLDAASIVEVTPDPARVGASAEDIVGTWDVDGEDATTLTFNSDGTYVQNQGAGVDLESCPQGGIESGAYAWDPETGILQATVLQDDNMSCGLSDNRPPFRIFVDGNSLSIDEQGVLQAIATRQ